jgi:DNA-binding response OmpR family regulator
MTTKASIARSGADSTNATHSDDAGERERSVRVAKETILLVDDDERVLDVFRRALERSGFSVFSTTTAGAAIDLGRLHPIDLMIIDLNLPDVSGLEIVRRAAAEGHARPFILMSAFLNVEISVEAMKLGAFDVLEKPVTVDRLIAVVQDCLQKLANEGRIPTDAPEAIHVPRIEGHPGSAAGRWAMYVVKACEAEGDLKTIEEWARCAGVSYSTLCESCRIIGLQPQPARDFTRALRAMIKSTAYRCDPSVLLDISDRRTLKLMCERAGPYFRSSETTSIGDFIRHQRFLPVSNEGIRMLLGYFEHE